MRSVRWLLPAAAVVLLAGCGAAPAAPPAAPSAAWPTYHADAARTGYSPGTPALGRLTRAWVSPRLDGKIYAEPLAQGGHVFVATENDTVYALSARDGHVVWRTHLGSPVPRSSLPCGDINPTGITGTPVLDPATGTLYAVGFLRPYRHYLYALSSSDGKVLWRRRVDPAGSHPQVEQQRAALAMAHGRVYVAYGGLAGDCGPYHGWVVGVPASGKGKAVSYRVPTRREGGIWAPSGPAVDAAGNLFVATGNGSARHRYDQGDSVLKLSPKLQLLSSFAPRHWALLNRTDRDLGSTGPALLGNHLLFQIGKQGVGYLLSTRRLGGIGGYLFRAPVCAAAFGGTAWDPPYLYVPCVNGLTALRVGPGAAFRVAWRSPAFRAGHPVVAGGAVWTVNLARGILMALGTRHGRVRAQVHLGPTVPFTTPAVAGGLIVVATGQHVVALAGA